MQGHLQATKNTECEWSEPQFFCPETNNKAFPVVVTLNSPPAPVRWMQGLPWSVSPPPCTPDSHNAGRGFRPSGLNGAPPPAQRRPQLTSGPRLGPKSFRQDQGPKKGLWARRRPGREPSGPNTAQIRAKHGPLRLRTPVHNKGPKTSLMAFRPKCPTKAQKMSLTAFRPNWGSMALGSKTLRPFLWAQPELVGPNVWAKID